MASEIRSKLTESSKRLIAWTYHVRLDGYIEPESVAEEPSGSRGGSFRSRFPMTRLWPDALRRGVPLDAPAQSENQPDGRRRLSRLTAPNGRHAQVPSARSVERYLW